MLLDLRHIVAVCTVLLTGPLAGLLFGPGLSMDTAMLTLVPVANPPVWQGWLAWIRRG